MNKHINRAVAWGLSRVGSKRIIAEYHKRTSGSGVDYTRQGITLSKREVNDFIRAITSATDPENPRLGEWMRFKENMRMDGHLMSCVENRLLPVQCAAYKLVDKNNDEDTEAKKLLERPWHLALIGMVCSHTFDGVKLIEMFELSEDGHITEVKEVPQSNFIPQRGIILIEEYDQDGVSYRDGAYKNYYFQVGGDWNMGIFSQLAPIVLAKKLGLGSWMSYIDKFGVPPLFAITDRLDPKRQKELFDMLESFRMNQFAILQGNEKVEIPQGYNVDAHNTFKSLMTDICDKEMSKRILGSSGLTDEKAFVGAAEVQERILGYRHKVDKLFYKFYFNTEIKPRLVKLSPVYAPLADLTFEYDESEILTVKEIIEAISKLAPYYEFDAKELAKITGLPITKIRATISDALGSTEKQEDAGSQKKSNPSGLAELSLPFAAAWDDLLKKVNGGELKGEELDSDTVLATYGRLSKSAALGYGKDYYTAPLARKMRDNLLRFAGTKTYVQQQELKGLGNEEARKYLDLQNGAYLDVQAAWSARSAQAARQYGEFVADKDIYPNLRFRTMRDKDVRPAHAALEGMVLGVDDPRLDEYMPPLDPGCRCWLEQTRAAADEKLPDYHPDPQWSGNPGKTGVIFNDLNSYNQRVGSDEVSRGIRQHAEILKEQAPYSHVIREGDHKVHVNDFADPKDLEQNIAAAQILARQLKRDIYIRHHVEGGIVEDHSNPELGIGKASTLGDLKTYDRKRGGFANFVSNNVKKANKQGVAYVVLDITDQSNVSNIWRFLKGALNDRNRNITHVILIYRGNAVEVSREQLFEESGTAGFAI